MTRFCTARIAFAFLIALASLDRVEAQIPLPLIEQTSLVDYVNCVDDCSTAATTTSTEPADSPIAASKSNQPMAFLPSTMAADLVPPFPAHPKLMPTKYSASSELSFEENTPASKKEESIDDCCSELSKMIAGNLESDISLEAKTMMVETALKMVSRNIALKAEARITKLKADHALEMAHMQSQMGQMRAMGSAANQINAIAGPLSQMLQRNYQQSVVANQTSERLSQTLGQIGYQRLEQEAAIAKQGRERIRLTTPIPAETENERHVALLTDKIARLQGELQSLQQRGSSQGRISPVGYSQPLKPLRQPLEPLPMGYRR